MTTNQNPPVEGCTRKCRLAGTHTLVWGQCEQAPAPEPTVSLSRVYTDTDGQRSIGFDTYTVDQLAELLDPVLGFEAMRAREGAVDLAHLAAHVIVHRHDAPSAAPAGQTHADRTALRQHLVEAALSAVEAAMDDTLLPAAREKALSGIAAVLPPPADQATEIEHQPSRGDQFEQWLKAQRDEWAPEGCEPWWVLDQALDLYRRHADSGTPLHEHVCPGSETLRDGDQG